MSTSNRTDDHDSYHHGDLRAALLAAAAELLAENGSARLSLREVTRRVGVSHAAAYRHFRSREALLAAVAAEGFVQLAALMEAELLEAGDDPDAQFIACAVSYVRFALGNPARFRAMFSGWSVNQPSYPELSSAAGQSFGVVHRVMRHGQAGGIFQSEASQRLALTAWSLVHGLATLLLEDQIAAPANSELDAERLARRCALIALHGFRAAP